MHCLLLTQSVSPMSNSSEIATEPIHGKTLTLVSSTRRPLLERSLSLLLLLLSIYSLLIPAVLQAVRGTDASPLLVKSRFPKKQNLTNAAAAV
ncbi:unnamed protein product [Brassica rapa subsp. narinosa]